MHTEPRATPLIRKVVFHTNEGPETLGGAASLARFLQSIQGGYHYIVDNLTAVRVAADNQEVWGATGMNSAGLHICFIGFAGQDAAGWADPYSQAELKIAAPIVRDWCQKYSLRMEHLTDEDIRNPNGRGICGHGDVSRAKGIPGGHWDPGPHFPWTQAINLINNKPAPAPTPKPQPPKVKPMHPAIQVPGGGWIAEAADPKSEGCWLLGPEGHVYALLGAPFKGGANGKLVAGDKAAKIRPWKTGDYTVSGKPGTYTIITEQDRMYCF